MRLSRFKGAAMITLAQKREILYEPIRLRIVMHVIQGDLHVYDFMSIFQGPQSKISRQLRYLKHSGPVRSRRGGAWMHYTLRESSEGLLKEQGGCKAALAFRGVRRSGTKLSRSTNTKAQGGQSVSGEELGLRPVLLGTSRTISSLA